jgi:hypothetical protein
MLAGLLGLLGDAPQPVMPTRQEFRDGLDCALRAEVRHSRRQVP